jgi:glycosidase
MSSRLLYQTIACFILLLPHWLSAQVSCDPVFPNVNSDVTIYFDATQGNGALNGVSPVYAHMGVITNLSTSPSDWKHVTTTWGIADPVGAMTLVSPNLWKKTINIQTFFNIAGGETVLKLSFVFRNTSGSIVGRASDGSDIFYPVYPANGVLQTIFVQPVAASFLSAAGAQIPVKAAASKTASLVLYDNGVQVGSANGLSLQTTLSAGSIGVHTVSLIATAGTEKDTATFVYLIPASLPLQNPPAGTELGINYIDDHSVRLELYAPKKQIVYAIGDFSNWLPDPAYQMHLSTDSTTWWIDISGITPGQTVRFQYLVDGLLRIPDPLSTTILDAGNDPFIPATTYPNLPAYPTGQTSGIVSVLKTGQQPFNWQSGSYVRPKKTDLVIYELLMRDFLSLHDYPTLLDTLDYFQRLGVTAIELMPINEFEGNNSWGYNPSFHKALDKYYGTPEAFKMVVDACHARGIAVILDVVFNHVTGTSPLAQLYWDATNNRPAANNPWLNPIPKHEYNVFNDFNHESLATKAYVKNCLKYWLTEFRVDGFRFDLSKGFTQKNTLGNMAALAQYDPTRIAILKDYANSIWSVDPARYVILEHFADNTEETELANYGMMLWGNVNGSYIGVAGGTPGGLTNSLLGVSYTSRAWTVPHLVGYMESHDEERVMYQNETNGGINGTYNVKFISTGLKRMEMVNNLFYTIPGPKMLWEFGELGYDYTINRCEDGTINNNCRLSPKPIRWDFQQDPARRHLHDVTAALLHLRSTQPVFETADFQLNVGSGAARSIRLNSAGLNVHVVANAGTAVAQIPTNFQHTGTWYEYYTGATIDVTNPTAGLSLQPGEYHLYLDQFIPLPPGIVLPTTEVAGAIGGITVFPNPTENLAIVDLNLSDPARIQIQVLDLTGRLVFATEKKSLPAGEVRYEIYTEQWQPGVYIIVVQDDSGAQTTRKLVKL